MNKQAFFLPPVLLQRSHAVDNFDCGVEALNLYLKKFALVNNQNNSSRTYVALRDGRVIGYYTLAPGSVVKQDVPERVGKGLGNYPVPVILLARLAVDGTEHGVGVGKGLLRHALLQVIFAADKIGGRAVVVHAKNENAKSFYEYFNFQPFPANPFYLCLLIKDIENVLRK